MGDKPDMELADAFLRGWNGPGEKPHTYSPDYMAMGDCRICGHTREAHDDASHALVKAAEQSFFELVVDGIAEADRAMRKFPQPNYVISKVAEEAGEVVKAAIHCAEGRETAANVKGEMRQLIAMLYRLWVEGDQVHGLAAIRTEPTTKGEKE